MRYNIIDLLKRAYEGLVSRTGPYKKLDALYQERGIELSTASEKIQGLEERLTPLNAELEAQRRELDSNKGQLEKEKKKYEAETARLRKAVEDRDRGIEREHKDVLKLQNRLGERSKVIELLKEDLHDKFMELVLTRIGKGEKAAAFSCPEAMDELMKRYQALRADNDTLFEDRMNLRYGLREVTGRFYNAVFTSLGNVAGLEKGFSMIYINPQCQVASHVGEVSQLLRLSEGETVDGVRVRGLLRKMPENSRKRLIASLKEGNENYTKVTLNDGKKVDVLLQKVEGPEKVNGGVFVYIREHHLIHKRKGMLVRGLLDLFEEAGSELRKLYTEEVRNSPLYHAT